MKSFLEEYGIVIVVAVVIIALIGVAVWFKTNGTASIKDWLSQFIEKGGLTNNIPAEGTSGGEGTGN